MKFSESFRAWQENQTFPVGIYNYLEFLGWSEDDMFDFVDTIYRGIPFEIPFDHRLDMAYNKLKFKEEFNSCLSGEI